MPVHRYSPLERGEDTLSRRDTGRARARVMWGLPLVIGLACFVGYQHLLMTAATTPTTSSVATRLPDQYKVPSSFPSHVTAMLDATRDPCDDFYQFACGKWMQTFEMPSTVYYFMLSSTPTEQSNREVLRNIVTSNKPLVTTSFQSCVNLQAINQLGNQPLRQVLSRLDKVQSVEQLMQLAGELSLVQFHFLTNLFVGAEDKHARVNTLKIKQADLTIDPSYFLDETAWAALEHSYRTYLLRLLRLTEISDHGAMLSESTMAKRILRLEQHLALIMQPPSDLTDALKRYNPMQFDELRQRFPLSIGAIIDSLLAVQRVESPESMVVIAPTQTVIVQTPQYFDALEAFLATVDLATWKLYFKYRYVNFAKDLLSEDFLETSFGFFGQQLEGLQDPPMRQETCIDQMVRLFPNRMGKYYADLKFDAESDKAARQMLHSIEHAMQQRLVENESWLDEPTRQAALAKIPKLVILLGHSDQLEYQELVESNSSKDATDSSPSVLHEQTYFANTMLLYRLARLRELAKLHLPVDRSEWQMAASDVNAYYDEVTNHMEYPAGILQPPLFSGSYLAAINYGATGVTMGHELTHAFDVLGRLYDGDGNLAPWWTNETNSRFAAKAACIEQQYSQFELPSCFNESKILGKVDGHLTLGESMADLGGLAVAFDAYKHYAATHEPPTTQSDRLPQQEAMDMDQLFYISFAQSWCTVNSDEDANVRLKNDVHAPIMYRVNGPVMNDDNFARVFNCPIGTKMNPTEKCHVW